MAVLQSTVIRRLDAARAIRLAELSLIPLSNNAVAAITWRTGLDLYPLLAVGLYLYAVTRHLKTAREAFRWQWSSVGLGAGAALVMGIPSLLFFVHPVLVGSIHDGPLAQASISSVNGLLRRLLVDLPVMTALIEELIFRSLLFVPLGSLRRTLAMNAGLFTLWHGVAAYTSVQATSLGHSPGVLLLSYAGALGSVFVGGLVFAFVRWKTGSFLYSTLTHWLTDALILVALWGVSHLGW